jgi:hypothetical protein
MSLLNGIIQKVSSGQRHTEEWIVLRNSYFRGESPIDDLQAWADANAIDLLIRYKERSMHAVIVESVTFLPKKKAK